MYRERLTITLDAELLEAVDTTIDRSLIRNRSHAIEHLLREGLALHQLTQAFLILDESWDSSTLPKVVAVCDRVGISEYFLIASSLTSSLVPDITSSIKELSRNQPSVTQLPGDFGSGGAIILKKDQLMYPFLIVQLSQKLIVPARLAAAYSFHRLHDSVLTQVLTSADASDYHSTGFTISNPELVHHIPAGSVSLEETVFPALLKEGKVKGYVAS